MDAFVARLKPDGSSLDFLSYLGGMYTDAGYGVAIDRQDNAYIVGAASRGFPVFNAPARIAAGAFVVKIAFDNRPAPLLQSGSVVSSASYRASVVPGSLVTIFGQNLVKGDGIFQASGYPLPTELNGTSVRVNGTPAPVLAVAKGNGIEQVNFQAPVEVLEPVMVAVSRDGTTGFLPVSGTSVDPAIFTIDGVLAAAQHGADFAPISRSRPAAKGETIVLYATGLGPVNPAVASGTPAPRLPLSRTTVPIDVYVAGQLAAVSFSGLTPDCVGVYQLNVEIPANAPSGDLDVVVGIGYLRSNVAKISVR